MMGTSHRGALFTNSQCNSRLNTKKSLKAAGRAAARDTVKDSIMTGPMWAWIIAACYAPFHTCVLSPDVPCSFQTQRKAYLAFSISFL